MVSPALLYPGGTEALLRNIKNHPQTLTGDHQFDAIAQDIFTRMLDRDPKVLQWDERVKSLVGLYDQATQGDIPSDQACKEPDFSGRGMLWSALKAVSNLDGTVDTYRRAAHTHYLGKSKDEAIEEFKQRAAALYSENGETVPAPPSPPSSPFAPSPEIVPELATEIPPLASPEDQSMADSDSSPDWQFSSIESSPNGESALSETTEWNDVTLRGSLTSGGVTPSLPGLPQPEQSEVSQGGWNKALAVGGGVAGLAALSALIVGGIMLLKKKFGKKKGKDQASTRVRRSHPRAWNVEEY